MSDLGTVHPINVRDPGTGLRRREPNDRCNYDEMRARRAA